MLDELFEQWWQLQPDLMAIQRLADGVLLRVNQALVQASGYKTMQLVGFAGLELPLWEDPARQKALMQAIIDGEEVRQQTLVLCTASTTRITLQVTGLRYDVAGSPFVLWMMRDISPELALRATLANTEKDLRLAQAKFNAAFQGAFDYIAISRLEDGTYLEVNEGYQEITGFTREETIGKRSIDLGTWRSPETRAEWVRKLRAEGVTRDYPMPLGTKSGPREGIMNARIIEIEGEECTLVTLRDVTDSHRTERALRQLARGSYSVSDDDYFERLTVDLAAAVGCDYAFTGFLTTDQPPLLHIAVYCHQGNTISMPPLAVAGSAFAAVVHQAETVLVSEQAAACYPQDAILQARQIVAFGATPLQTSGGKVIGVLGVMHDQRLKNANLVRSMLQVFGDHISSDLELQRTSQALTASEKKFAAIFHSSPVALSVSSFDGDCLMLDVNDTWLEQFSMTRDAVMGVARCAHDFWLDPGDWNALFEVIKLKGEIRRYQAWRRRPDGESLLCEISGRLIELEGQLFLLLTEEDITEKHKIEQELLELNATLESRVEDRTRRLKIANAELSAALDSLKMAQEELIRSEKLAALGAMVAGIAHELNTPLGNGLIVGSTLRDHTRTIQESMSKGMKRSELEVYLNGTATAADILTRNLERASELVSSFKQVAMDQTSSQRRMFLLGEVVSEIIVTLHPTIKKTPYRVENSIADNIYLDSFPGPLGQVITNLINNAIIHGFNGRPYGTIRLEAQMLDAKQVEMRVSDDGQGIPEAHLSKVFDPFFTTKLGQGGNGLGLNIVHSLVTGALGGKIALASTVGEGTTFTLVLPLVAPSAVVGTSH